MLDEHFGTESNEQQFNDYAFEEENEVFELAGRPTDSILRVNSQDSEESEDTYKGKFPRIFDVSSFKTYCVVQI